MKPTRAIISAALVVASMASVVHGQDRVRWQWDVERAKQQASHTNRLVLLHFWTRSCQPCLRLERDVFSQATFAAGMEEDFVPVKVNAEDMPSLATKYGITSVPTDVIIAPDGRVVARSRCPQTADQYLVSLRRIVDGDRQAATQFAQRSDSPDAGGPVRDAGRNQNDYGADSTAGYDRDVRPQTASSTAGRPSASASRSSAAKLPYGDPDANRPGVGADRQGLDVGRQGPDANRQASSSAWPRNESPMPSTGTRANAAGRSTPDESPAHSRSELAANAGERTSSPSDRAAAGPPLALEGHCPVLLTERHRWTPGDRRWGAVHRGRTYLFASPEAQQAFLADPDRYSPVLSGCDPIQWNDRGQLVSGRREFGVFYRNHVYLFASEESLNLFGKNPALYSAKVEQAMRSATTIRR
jgi:protein disulfide-isomerase